MALESQQGKGRVTRRILGRSVLLAATVAVWILVALPAASGQQATIEPEFIVCPDVPGYAPTFEAESRVSFNNGNGGYYVNCWYQSTNVDDTGGTVESELILDAAWATDPGDPYVEIWYPEGSEGAAITYCSDVDEFAAGIGLTASNGMSVRSTYKFREPQKPYDPEVGRIAALALRDLVAPFARTCDGVQIITRADYFSPLPSYLQGSFDGTAAPATTTAPPAETSTTAPETTTTTTTAAPAAGSAAPGVGSGNAAEEGSATLRIVGFALVGLSILGLAWTISRAGRERRVRPRFDIFRVVVIAGTAIGIMAVLANTPAWAVATGVGLGLILGWVQGRNVAVRIRGSRLYERRGVLAIVLFAAGLIVSQVARLLDRTGIIGIGVGISFLSAAIAAGVIAGRVRPIRAARSAAATGVIAIIAAGALALPVVAVAVAQEEPGLDERETQIIDQLVDAVAWDSVDLGGGLYAFEQKPFMEITVPESLEGVPEAVSRTVEWTVKPPVFDAELQDFVEADETLWRHYSVTESFSFGPGAEGGCCEVFYEGEGTEQIGDGPAIPSTASGSLGTFSPVAGRTYSSFHEAGRQAWALPFAEPEVIPMGIDESLCRRPLMQADRGSEPTWTVTLDGAPQDFAQAPNLNLYTDCEIEGFDVATASAALPPVPGSSDPARDVIGVTAEGGGCPVFQEAFGALEGGFEGAATDQIRRLMLSPNSSSCTGFVSMGDELPGGIRSEMDFALASPDPEREARRAYAAVESQLNARPAHEMSSLCEFDDRGIAIPPIGDGEVCEFHSFHQAGEGTIRIYTDYITNDGPNVIVEGYFPWGNYRYRCHHCDADSPEVPRIIAAMDVFGNTGIGNFGPNAEVIGSVGAPEGREGETTDVVDPVDPDLIEAITDDPYEAAVIAGLIGMAGVIGLAGASAVQERLDRRDDDPDEEVSVFDEETKTWVWLSPEEAEDLISRQREAEIAEKIRSGEERGAKDLERIRADAQAEAAAEDAAAAELASHRKRVWDWFDANPQYDHLWERVIRPDGSVDTELMKRIMSHAHDAGIDIPEIGFWEDFATATASEVFTGREADGSISWESMILRGIAGAVTWGNSEWVYTPADALVRIREAVESGDERAWHEIANDAAWSAVWDEIFGRAIGEGLTAGGTKLAEMFPSLSRSGREVLEEILERLNRPVGGTPAGALPPELDAFRRSVIEAIESGDDDAMRSIYAGGGMERLGQIEASGGLLPEQAAKVVEFHNALTREAIEQGTTSALSDWEAGLPQIKEVFIGNSGSTGASRSVVTDADRTIVVIFDPDELADFARATVQTEEAARDMLQDRFSGMQASRTADALQADAKLTPLTPEDLDIKNYPGIGTSSGQDDAYGVEYTRSRMSAFGDADVYTVNPDGSVTRTPTSGQALLDQMDMEQSRLTGDSLRGETHIPLEEAGSLHQSQITSIETHSDIKSVAKAVNREVKVVSMSGVEMPDDDLVRMASEIRAMPTETDRILAAYNYDSAEDAVADLQNMMREYDTLLRETRPDLFIEGS